MNNLLRALIIWLNILIIFLINLTMKRRKLTLITTLHEGFIVIDDSGKLLLANNTFADIIGKTEIIGKYFWELIHDNNFTDFIKIIRLSKTSNSIEIPIGENFYLASANYLTGKGLYVVILHDITKSKELEQIKKDFIVNVSHELLHTADCD